MANDMVWVNEGFALNDAEHIIMTSYIEKRSRERFLKELVGEMSRPVMPHEEARE